MKGSGNLDKYNDDMAFYIFQVEKEFNVGPIDETFPLMKFWNLVERFTYCMCAVFATAALWGVAETLYFIYEKFFDMVNVMRTL